MPDPVADLQRHTEHFISPDELRERLGAKRPLRVKLGVDPTRPDLTFGHMVVFNKLRQFQDLGHQAVLIIGDYTAMIGDPSGRSSTRPVLSEVDVKTNATTYLDQAFKILDRAKTEVRFNSEWFAKMSLGDLLNLSRKMTVARMLERDDFSKRYAANSPISIVEFLYPLIQGYDSVMIKSDVELGGSDQLFNNLVGRVLQKDAGQPEQIVICTPLLVGLDGVKKMSKSQDNYIAFNDAPKEMFGKIMSISDPVMWDYYSLLLEANDATIAQLKAGHPMAAKKNLALTLVGKFHGLDAGKRELEQFEKVFARHEIPDDIRTIRLNTLSFNQGSAQSTFTVSQLLSSTGEFESNKEIHRLIRQGSVKLNNQKITDPFYSVIDPPPGEPHIIQSGKRKFFKFI